MSDSERYEVIVTKSLLDSLKGLEEILQKMLVRERELIKENQRLRELLSGEQLGNPPWLQDKL